MCGSMVRESVEELADLLYPRRCAVCGRVLAVREKHLCCRCLGDFPYTYFGSWRENPAEMILWGRTYFRFVVSLFFYSRDNGYSRLVHRVKYGGDLPLGRYLGSMLGCSAASLLEDTDVIVPVPLHPIRKWRRGYNQSRIIAEGVRSGIEKDIPIINALRRRHYSSSQTTVNTGHKWENVSGSFVLNRKHEDTLKGKHLLLVDDVLTTGATAEACYDALKEIEGVSISLATLTFVKKM